MQDLILSKKCQKLSCATVLLDNKHWKQFIILYIRTAHIPFLFIDVEATDLNILYERSILFGVEFVSLCILVDPLHSKINLYSGFLHWRFPKKFCIKSFSQHLSRFSNLSCVTWQRILNAASTVLEARAMLRVGSDRFIIVVDRPSFTYLLTYKYVMSIATYILSCDIKFQEFICSSQLICFCTVSVML